MTQNLPEKRLTAQETLMEAFKGELNNLMGYLSELFPYKGGAEKFITLTKVAVIRDPTLLHQNRHSLLKALIWCAQKDLEPGVDDGCWLVPFKQVVTPIPAYKGLIKKAVETESVKDAQPWPVYEHDEFEYSLGTNPDLHHKPPPLGKDRGKLIGVYVVFTMLDGSKRFHVMDREEVEKIRAVSASWKAYENDKSKGSPWAEWEKGMFLKTVIKQGFKYIPVKAPLRDLISDDNRLDHGDSVASLLVQSGAELPEGLDDEQPAPPSEPPPKLDTSKFDKAVKKLKWDQETMTRLERWLTDTAAGASNKAGKIITPDMIKVSCSSRFEEFLTKFKEWQDLNYPTPPAGAAPGPEPEAAGPATTAPPVEEAGSTTQSPPGESSSDPGVRTIEDRREAVWDQVINKGIPLASLAVLDPPVSAPGHITEQNIGEAEELVATYQAPGKKK